ncbi:MAG TPA: O-antigen ligase family protein [Trebonia sp.]
MVRRAVLCAAGAALLAGPTVLAFFAGGYFSEPALWAGLAAWLVVLVAAVADPGGRPAGRAVWLAIAGLGLLAGWTLASTAWAPIKGDAYQAGQQALLYAGALIGAALLLRSRAAARWVEPVLTAGAVIVIGYGLSERLLPGLLHFARSVSAEGRLEQPLTYWNAMGELAAIGFVLCARMMGDTTRPRVARALAAAGAGPLGLGLYLSFSRGALFAGVAGLVALTVAAARTEQLRAIALAILAAAVAALVGSQLRGVTSLAGSLGTREGQGAIELVVLVAVSAAAGAAQWVRAGRERPAILRLPRGTPLIALIVLLAGLALAIVVGNQESSRESQSLSSGASRLVTLRSNRYAYWRVALRAFGDEPVRGVGAGGWSVYWLRYRTVSEAAQDAHSLPLQTAAELGVIGLLMLAAFIAGVARAAYRAHQRAPVLAVGPIAVIVVYIAHAPLDWDWQMPAVTLVAIAAAGALLALADPRGATGPARSRDGAPGSSSRPVKAAS